MRLSLKRRPTSSYYQDATNHLGRKKGRRREQEQKSGLLTYLDYCGDAPKIECSTKKLPRYALLKKNNIPKAYTFRPTSNSNHI